MIIPSLEVLRVSGGALVCFHLLIILCGKVLRLFDALILSRRKLLQCAV